MSRNPAQKSGQATEIENLDVLVIGAGFGGMYALHTLRGRGLSVRVYDEAGGIGGTWWWNRYPGARVDFPGGPFYCYTFSEELVQEWDWTDSQPDQQAVLGYLNHVADKFDLRRDIELETRVNSARYDEAVQRWNIETSSGDKISAQFLICALGTLSAAHTPNIPGLETFAGDCYHTGRWPQEEEVDFSGKRVGIIGTGSSGVQAIPVIASTAAQLTVFQRTPQYTIPAGNHALDPDFVQHTRDNWPEIRRRMMASPYGTPFDVPGSSSLDHTPEQRQALYEEFWRKGGLGLLFESYNDVLANEDTSNELGEFVRSKIGKIVQDSTVAKKLMPDYYFGTKRLIMDDGYYETFNRDNVTLADLREAPIVAITPTGVRTGNGEEHALDVLILATGYDAITGALERLNPRGRGEVTLKEKWEKRFSTYLGMTIADFPNLFMIHGPESPSVLFNMPLGAELQGDWIGDCIEYLRENQLAAIEPALGADEGWGRQVEEISSQTLFSHTDSWYTGANIPGKHRQFAVYLGAPSFYQILSDVAEKDYKGFVLEKIREVAPSSASG